jgi:hypothetical protein
VIQKIARLRVIDSVLEFGTASRVFPKGGSGEDVHKHLANGKWVGDISRL